MKSVDTNILVRYYAQDDALQSALAMSVFSDEPELFVTKTVLLEFFWVLTQADKFRFPPEQVMAAQTKGHRQRVTQTKGQALRFTI